MAQAISLALEIFGLPALNAGITSLAIAALARRLLPASIAERFALPSAVAIGFFAGYCVLPRESAPLWPAQARDWLPYVGFLAAAASAATIRLSSPARRSLLLATIIVAGCLLTPSWPILGLMRPASIGLSTAYLLLLAITLDCIPSRLLGPMFLLLLAAAAAALALAIGAYLSVRIAQLAAMAAASLGGGCLAALIDSKNTDPAIRGLIPVFVVLVGGVAWSASVEPDPPLVWILLLPLMPLAVWIAAARTKSS